MQHSCLFINFIALQVSFLEALPSLLKYLVLFTWRTITLFLAALYFWYDEELLHFLAARNRASLFLIAWTTNFVSHSRFFDLCVSWGTIQFSHEECNWIWENPLYGIFYENWVWCISDKLYHRAICQVWGRSHTSLRSWRALFVITPHPPKSRNYGLKSLLCMRMAFPYTTRENQLNRLGRSRSKWTPKGSNFVVDN